MGNHASAKILPTLLIIIFQNIRTHSISRVKSLDLHRLIKKKAHPAINTRKANNADARTSAHPEQVHQNGDAVPVVQGRRLAQVISFEVHRVQLHRHPMADRNFARYQIENSLNL